MGHGCYYTSPEYRTRAYWVEFPDPIDPEDNYEQVFMQNDAEADMAYTFCKLYPSFTQIREGLDERKWSREYREWFILARSDTKELIAHYGYGDELVFAVVPRYSDGNGFYSREWVSKSYEAMENRLAKRLAKIGYEIRYATSGYTSTKLAA